MAAADDSDRAGWVTVSDLAEYAYCPRAFWYGRHPPPQGPTPASTVARSRGELTHERELASRSRWERRGGAAWWLLGLGILLCLLAWAAASGL